MIGPHVADNDSRLGGFPVGCFFARFNGVALFFSLPPLDFESSWYGRYGSACGWIGCLEHSTGRAG